MNCFHMSHGDSYFVPAVLLVLTWIGAFLRNSVVLGSLRGCQSKADRCGATPCKKTDRTGATNIGEGNEVEA